jgi:hypothetical protein
MESFVAVTNVFCNDYNLINFLHSFIFQILSDFVFFYVWSRVDL